ncbi:MAG TPA: FMN-binding protein [Candidatus Paceibacterota bacterium]|nr:FMN-binding protein [Candidatus Paceibacterota bacterium]
MKKIIIAIILIVAIGGFAYWNSTKMQAATPVTTSTDTSNPTSVPSETTNPAAGGSNTTSSGSTGSTAATGQYKDGTYTGKVADAFYGNLQVQATISDGKITDVTFLQQPNTPQESVEVNAKSSPKLKSEAIAAQSAKVDIVSGATQSSEAFQQSLASALSQAQS